MDKKQIEDKVNELTRNIADTYIPFKEVPEWMLVEYKKYKDELIDIEMKEIENFMHQTKQIGLAE